jgi:hypothetical protein
MCIYFQWCIKKITKIVVENEVWERWAKRGIEKITRREDSGIITKKHEPRSYDKQQNLHV